ncbi:MAG TPA: hypothetical protein VGL97_24760, partial [Bryobacteraceae bacterium]
MLIALLAAPLAAVPPKVTFNGQIGPLVYHECAPCHRPNESGPFSLLNYEDAKKHATQIAIVTKQHFMPPWLPQRGYDSFAEERRLTDA